MILRICSSFRKEAIYIIQECFGISFENIKANSIDTTKKTIYSVGQLISGLYKQVTQRSSNFWQCVVLLGKYSKRKLFIKVSERNKFSGVPKRVLGIWRIWCYHAVGKKFFIINFRVTYCSFLKFEWNSTCKILYYKIFIKVFNIAERFFNSPHAYAVLCKQFLIALQPYFYFQNNKRSCEYYWARDK